LVSINTRYCSFLNRGQSAGPKRRIIGSGFA
jgi:hypothetical protein